MKKAVTTALTVAAGFYMSVSGVNYAALGDLAPDSVLEANFQGIPDFVPMVANVMIALHMMSAVQIYSQPLFANTEAVLRRLFAGGCGRKRPAGDAAAVAAKGVARASADDGAKQRVGAPAISRRRELVGAAALRLVVRTVMVGVGMLLATVIPSFSSVIGLVGALLFWPAGVFYPLAMWARIHAPGRGVRAGMLALNLALLVVSVAATVGSVYGIVKSLKGLEG